MGSFGVGREEVSFGEDVYWSGGVGVVEAGVAGVNGGFLGSFGSYFFYFGCLRDRRVSGKVVGCFFFL